MKYIIFLFLALSLSCSIQIDKLDTNLYIENETSNDPANNNPSPPLTPNPQAPIPNPSPLPSPTPGNSANECENWQANHPEWIFCDDFETGQIYTGNGSWYETNSGDDNNNFSLSQNEGLDNSYAVKMHFNQGTVNAGWLSLGFGRNPVAYMDKGIRSNEDFREIWHRVYVKMQAGWVGSPAKLSRATVVANSSWAQAMISHYWHVGEYTIGIDPASGVRNGQVTTTRWNDIGSGNLDWLGYRNGTYPIYHPDYVGEWVCVEMHTRLNDSGRSNGVAEIYINGILDVGRSDLNFVGTYTQYGLNVVTLESYWNSGSPQAQDKFYDNFVLSTQRIGCL